MGNQELNKVSFQVISKKTKQQKCMKNYKTSYFGALQSKIYKKTTSTKNLNRCLSIRDGLLILKNKVTGTDLTDLNEHYFP